MMGFWRDQATMFAAEAGALWRQGLNDARNLLMGEWGAGVTQPGTLGNPTQQLVTQEFQGVRPPDDWRDQPPPPAGPGRADPGVAAAQQQFDRETADPVVRAEFARPAAEAAADYARDQQAEIERE